MTNVLKKSVPASFVLHNQMKVIINCGKSDIRKGKQVVSLVKRFSNAQFRRQTFHEPNLI